MEILRINFCMNIFQGNLFKLFFSIEGFKVFLLTLNCLWLVVM